MSKLVSGPVVRRSSAVSIPVNEPPPPAPTHASPASSKALSRSARRWLTPRTVLLFLAAATLAFRAFSHRTTRSRSRQVVWSDRAEGIKQHWMTKPWETYRLTALHALMRRDNETYEQGLDGNRRGEGSFVQVLAFVEETPYPPPTAAPWQVLSAHRRVIESVHCVYSSSHLRSNKSTTGWVAPSHPPDGLAAFNVPPDLEWVTIINCPVPTELASLSSGSISLDVVLHLHKANEPFSLPITLAPSRVPSAEPGSTSICVSPMWGHTPASSLLEWRQHHLALGFETVHWYARDGSVREWVEALNDVLGARDDFFHAPPVSRETFGKARGALEDAGQYADQAIYYQHCKLLSLSSSTPTEWIAFTDLDEYFLPNPLSLDSASTALSTYLLDRPSTTGSVCIPRTNYRRPSAGHHPLPLGASSYFPLDASALDATKCIHRVRGVETGWVHLADMLYPGYSIEMATAPDAPLRILHDDRRGGDGPLRLAAGAQEKAYFRRLEATMEKAERKLGIGSGETSRGWPSDSYATLFNLRVPVSEDHHHHERYSSDMGYVLSQMRQNYERLAAGASDDYLRQRRDTLAQWLSNPSTILPYLYGPTQTEYAVYEAELRRREEAAAAAQNPHSLGVVRRRDGRAARRAEEQALAHEGMGLRAGLMYWGRRY
ncbi:hypothetical protein JCM10450v2_007598 [Rhodotorula kratochvilovae]